MMVTPAFNPRGTFVGFDSADNGFPTTRVLANRYGSAYERLTDLEDQSRRSVQTGAALLVNGTTVFTVAGGPIRVLDLLSYVIVGGDSTAATLQWSADGTVGAATTFTGTSSALTSLAAGGVVYCNFTALTTAPVITQTAGVALAGTTTSTGGGIYVPAGIITMVIGSGPTVTATYKHFMRFEPMAPGVTVTAAF
jgi:hypothetical protein